MTPPRAQASDPCIVTNCPNTRHVTASGKVMARCTDHHREYRRFVDAENRKREAAGIRGNPGRRRELTMPEHLRGKSTVTAQCVPLPPKPKSTRLPGKPRRPTVVIDEQARVVRQIRGNEIVREYPLPERGLHEETLAILKYRGWKIKFERGAA